MAFYQRVLAWILARAFELLGGAVVLTATEYQANDSLSAVWSTFDFALRLMFIGYIGFGFGLVSLLFTVVLWRHPLVLAVLNVTAGSLIVLSFGIELIGGLVFLVAQSLLVFMATLATLQLIAREATEAP